MSDEVHHDPGSEVGDSREPAVISDQTDRELITGVFFDAKGARREYAYTAVGFAYERVERMLNPGRHAWERP